MRPFIFILTSTFFACSCNDNSDKTSKAESKSNHKNTLTLDTLREHSIGKMTLVSSGQFSPSVTIKIDNCDFDLVTTNNDTTYLSTKDKKFLTPEGYYVGTKFLELPKSIQRNLTKEPGWGYYYELSSGWTLGFCEGNSCTDHYPRNLSQVKWIFKRR